MRRLLALVPLLLAPRAAPAQRLDLSLYTLSGSGLSATSGSGETLASRSPVFLDVEVGAAFDPEPGWEWTPGLIAEIEDRVSFGVSPQVKRVLRGRRIGYYATGGVPMFFRPFTLMGFEVGGGLLLWLRGEAAIVLEIRGDFFFVGGDLPEDAMLAKFDAGLGFRLGL